MRGWIFTGLVVATVVATAGALWVGIRHLAAERTVATGAASEPLVVYIGNSFTGGSAEDSGVDARFPHLVSVAVRARGMTITADASGYVTRGANLLDYGDLAADVPADAAVVVFLGSDDDATASRPQIMGAARSAWRTVHERAPRARVLVVGTPWVSADPPEGILRSRDAVRDAAKAVGLPFVDPLADRWWVGDVDGAVGADGLHPTDLGHLEMATELEPVVARLLDHETG
jgi:lysophospholipase L1-like esterase